MMHDLRLYIVYNSEYFTPITHLSLSTLDVAKVSENVYYNFPRLA